MASGAGRTRSKILGFEAIFLDVTGFSAGLDSVFLALFSGAGLVVLLGWDAASFGESRT